MIGKIRYNQIDWNPVPVGDTLGAEVVANWMCSDIQFSLNTLNIWLDVFAKVADGTKESGYQGTGNAHTITAIDELILIENEYFSNKQVLMTYAQINHALKKYKSLVIQVCDDNVPDLSPFTIEYEAEGEDASYQLTARLEQNESSSNINSGSKGMI